MLTVSANYPERGGAPALYIKETQVPHYFIVIHFQNTIPPDRSLEAQRSSAWEAALAAQRCSVFRALADVKACASSSRFAANFSCKLASRASWSARLWLTPGNSATHRSNVLKCARKKDSHWFASRSSLELLLLLSVLPLLAGALLALLSAERLLPLFHLGLAVVVVLIVAVAVALLLALDSKGNGAAAGFEGA